MSDEPRGPMQPLRFDLSEMVRKSVATLYSHLVTRPTGQALRLGIESQIGEVGSPCVSILDFRQVVVMDYSCADEAVAKLLRRYVREEAEEVYFFARGVGERHIDTIDAVLVRHGLALVVQFDDDAIALLGPVSARELRVWEVVQAKGRARAAEVASDLRSPEADVDATLARLSRRRVLA
ncbi:MAG: hypothetical protein ACRELV_17240, partial [Longimicrobiales bacterium]